MAASPSLARDLEHDLRRRVSGEVRFDPISRVLYSTDASIYEIEPIGVVVPRDEGDVQAVVEVARSAKVPLLPRGGGTSLAGQAVGRALVLDFSKYMNRVLEVDAEAGWARVQPGIVRDELVAALAPTGLTFGPETSTSNRATIGGMIGNNSSGARSIVYGKTVDNVLAVRVVLAGGETVLLEPLPLEEARARGRREGAEGRLYREILRIVEATRDEVARRFPKILRRVGGYNLDEFPPGGPINLAKLVVGSEGTLGVVTEATLRLAPRPRLTALAVLHFDDLIRALESTCVALETGPAAVELIDKLVLDMARQAREHARRMTFVEGDPEALIVVEYAGESPEELRGRLEDLETRLRRWGFRGPLVRLVDPSRQADLWAVRKAGVGLLLGMKTARKPIAFVEDTAVAPERVAEYVRRFREIVERHGTRASFYGHASVGLLHARPILDLKTARDVEEMRQIAEEISDLVLEFGGALSGEHGDGLARSQFTEKMFGPTLYRAFREVKAAFDPEGLMNPGKIVDAPPMTESLRYGPSYRAAEVPTIQDFSREGGFAAAVELCSGVGACRKLTGGTMCPSYMATREEAHSTRGRANALRAVLSGRLPLEALSSREMYDVMDLCLGCKACKAECPSNVDMAKLKHEVLARHHAAHGVPLRARLFGHIATLGALGSATAPVSTWLVGSAPVRWVLERAVGIAASRPLPAFARTRFTRWWHQRERGADSAGRRTPEGVRGIPGGGRVALFVDTFTEFYSPQIGRAAVRLLEAAGCEVTVVQTRCCGRPLISQGLLREAQHRARANLARLQEVVDRGIPLVGLEPSCTVTLKDEYPDLVPGEVAERVARHTYTIDEYLALLLEGGALAFRPQEPRRVMVHGHCHQKAMVGMKPTLSLLRSVPGYVVEEVDGGCCGMAGSFGMEREHYTLSMAIGERVLFKAVRALPPEALLVADGASCRQQIAHGTGRDPLHVVEALARAL
jgi:FAD/FMN-containing dehydrogenase/Fe-S oxidoreductase